jgi:epoxyqueuosine reductase
MISTIIENAKGLGFIAIGFSRPENPLFFDFFSAWIAAGRQGGMHWLGKHMDLREDPGRLLEGCRAVISLAYPYASRRPRTADGFTVARYVEAPKADYHQRLKRLAQDLSREINAMYPGTRTRICVDSAPILERSFAYLSGMGFIGKNNMLIVPGHGSYVFLAEILVTASLRFPEVEPMRNQCGTCTRCVDACPTGALEGPHSFNASRCLSYLTIEYPGGIDAETGQKMGRCFFGCDVCQEVCPFNEPEPSEDVLLPSTTEILGMGPEAFKTRFGNTPFNRAGLERLKRNIRAIKSVTGA